MRPGRGIPSRSLISSVSLVSCGRRRPVSICAPAIPPDWSPDGQRILFHDNLDLPDESSNLYTVRPDGTGLRH
ncbi:MAG TPA: hypothetical protein VFC16_13545 [Nakamurella sp.]|nr:hypothetical protein [Nakamurella sp.]